MAKLKAEARLLNESEIGQWGVFLSHSGGSEEQIRKLCESFDRENISYLWDKQISVGSHDFAEEIHTMIYKCMCAVVIVNENAIHSQWVNFEIGLLDGLGKRVFLYDESGLLDQKIYRYHYDKFCPTYHDTEALTEAIKAEKMFYSLFNHETADLSSELFKNLVDQYIVPVQFTINIPGLSSIKADTYKINSLIISFGNFTDRRHCEESICSQTLDEIDNDTCEQTGKPCCMNFMPDRSENPECVLLNHIWEKITVSGDQVDMILPLHKTMGTTFKLFIDTEYGETADALLSLLNQYGTDANLSKSGTQNRVYFSLRSSALKGIFRLKDPYSNNFICPGIARL